MAIQDLTGLHPREIVEWLMEDTGHPIQVTLMLIQTMPEEEFFKLDIPRIYNDRAENSKYLAESMVDMSVTTEQLAKLYRDSKYSKNYYIKFRNYPELELMFDYAYQQK